MVLILSNGFLAASMLLGQTGAPSAGSGNTYVPAPPTLQQQTQPLQQTQPTQRPILGWLNREDRPVLNRIQGWFKRDPSEAPGQGKSIQSSRTVIRETESPPLLKPAAPEDFPRKMPNPSSEAPTKAKPIAQEAPVAAPEVQPASLQQPVLTQSPKSPILPQLANKIGRDENFEWITGQIEVENGNYVMYYATPETTDKFNGRIALAPQQVDLSQFRRGDLVSVRGQLMQRQAVQGMMPIYRVSLASLIERPK